MFEFLADDASLGDFLVQHQETTQVFVDTEFLRERTYYPQLCLIQIATDEGLACVDPLGISDLHPLWEWLNDPRKLKVFHAAGQDLEIIHYLSQTIPQPIFDTQIAAGILGLGDQIGYAKLVQHFLSLTLDKSQSRTDWSKRPLGEKQLNYAIEDVRQLKALFPTLLEQLEKSGRKEWMSGATKKLSDPKTYTVAPRETWKKVKGAQFLKPKQLNILRELSAWREEKAMQKNLPKRWVVNDENLIDMAKMSIMNLSDLQNLRQLKPDTLKRYGKTWLKIIDQANAQPMETWPESLRPQKLDQETALVADLIMILIGEAAHHHGVTAAMIATRKQVESMLREKREKLSEDWRGDLVNERIQQLLRGELSFHVKNGKMELIKADSSA